MTDIIIPNLAGVATQNLVSQIGAGSYKADYINWARTLQLLREHAPGWLPELVKTRDGDIVHRAPCGGYLLIRFRRVDGEVTPEVPHAVMNNKNEAVPYDQIDARDITDTHRRGACMAACFTFGLAYELWAKMPLESGYQQAAPPEVAPIPDALLAEAQAAASAGNGAYAAFWKRIGPEKRKQIGPMRHADLKLVAAEAPHAATN